MQAIPYAEVQPLMSVAEVARALGWSKNTVYALIHDGTFEPVRQGRNKKIRTADLRHYLRLPVS